jgi:hypothetical protein
MVLSMGRNLAWDTSAGQAFGVTSLELQNSSLWLPVKCFTRIVKRMLQVQEYNFLFPFVLFKTEKVLKNLFRDP